MKHNISGGKYVFPSLKLKAAFYVSGKRAFLHLSELQDNLWI